MLKNNQNKYLNGKYHDEHQYLNLISEIIKENELFVGRNGNTLSIFGNSMHFSLENNTIPFLTTKKLAWKTCLKELLWFIKGDTSNERLNKQNVHIWDSNASREFLTSRSLEHYNDGDLGPIYGFQWRHFNAKYENCDSDYTNKGVDQLQNIIDLLKNPETRNSRRLIMSAWNPCQLKEMVLPPCHVMCQFHVKNDNKLCCSLYQRSGDVGLGVPFNIASYSFLTHILAKHCGLIADEFVYFLGNAHIYEEHIEKLEEQIKREPYKFPKLEILNKYDNIEDYTINDFKINNYEFHENINLLMRQ